jgi:transposase
MVLWRDEGYSADEVAALAGVSRPTVNTWVRRYGEAGLDGLVDRPKPGKPAQVPGQVRARILALTRSSPPPPPPRTGLSHWSSREMARYLKAFEGIDVSHNFVADLWREHNLQPHRTGTFKVPLSTGPNCEAKISGEDRLWTNAAARPSRRWGATCKPQIPARWCRAI